MKDRLRKEVNEHDLRMVTLLHKGVIMKYAQLLHMTFAIIPVWQLFLNFIPSAWVRLPQISANIDHGWNDLWNAYCYGLLCFR